MANPDADRERGARRAEQEAVAVGERALGVLRGVVMLRGASALVRLQLDELAALGNVTAPELAREAHALTGTDRAWRRAQRAVRLDRDVEWLRAREGRLRAGAEREPDAAPATPPGPGGVAFAAPFLIGVLCPARSPQMKRVPECTEADSPMAGEPASRCVT